MQPWKKVKPLVISCTWLIAVYYSPHFIARFCVHEGRMLSYDSIVGQTADWFIKNQYPNAELKLGGLFDAYALIDEGEIVLTFEIGKFGLWDPLFSDFSNSIYVYNGGNTFFIFDACGNLIGSKM